MAFLTIGEFARATYLSVKALRHYDDLGLLRPAEVDGSSGYRRYAIAQVPVARVIRRFRELDMPLDEIRAVLDAPDGATRDATIVAHLRRMEEALEQTQVTVSSLRALLEGGATDAAVEFRAIAAQLALTRRADVGWDEATPWLHETFAVLQAALARDPAAAAGVPGALFSPEFFEAHLGPVVAYVPVARPVAVDEPLRCEEVDGARVAVIEHRGPFAEIDQTYSALGVFVAERGLGADGPVREHYVHTPPDDESAWQVEVCWPVRE